MMQLCGLCSSTQAILPGANEGLKIFNIMLPILSVALSATVGVCGGLLLSIVMRPHSILVPSLPGMSPTAQLRCVGIYTNVVDVPLICQWRQDMPAVCAELPACCYGLQNVQEPSWAPIHLATFDLFALLEDLVQGTRDQTQPLLRRSHRLRVWCMSLDTLQPQVVEDWFCFPRCRPPCLCVLGLCINLSLTP